MFFFRSARKPASHASSPRVAFEGLESRRLMAAGPSLTAVEILGQPTAVTGVVLTFNEPLDLNSAQNANGYSLGHPPAQDTSSSGFDFTSLLFRQNPGHEKPDTARVRLTRGGRIIFSAATYNSATDSVTLTPVAPFKAQSWFRFLRIKGTGPYAIKDTNGESLNGGADTVARWSVHTGRTIHFTDLQHNHVTLKLTGPGRLQVFIRGTNHDPIIFVEGATSASQLTGSIRNPRTLFPVVNIGQIEGLGSVRNNLVNNPSFTIQAMTP